MPTPQAASTLTPEGILPDDSAREELAAQITGTNRLRAKVGLPPLTEEQIAPFREALQAAYVEAEHPRGPDGRWIYKSIFPDEAAAELSRPELHPAQRAALERYTTNPATNFLLRDELAGRPRSAESFTHDDALHADIAQIDAVMNQTSVPRPIKVYRGGDTGIFRGAEAGSVVTDGGYTSTSVEKATADDFTFFATAGGDPGAEITINLPVHTKGLYAAPYELNEYADQGEFIIARGTSYHVDSIRTGDGGRLHVEMTVVKQMRTAVE